MGPDLTEERVRLATACRLLAREGLMEGVLGHVSLRVGQDRLLVRCRGPRECGLLFTTADDIRLLDFAGGGDLGEYAAPVELPLHVETLRARPEVMSVVHTHPPAVVTADLAGVALRPVVGAFNIPATRLAIGGIPVYPRSVLIRRRELAEEMLAAMGDRPVCTLRGHGLITVGATIEQAVVRALSVDDLARLSLDIARCGGSPTEVSAEDLADLPDVGSHINESFVYRFHEARLRHEGLGV